MGGTNPKLYAGTAPQSENNFTASCISPCRTRHDDSRRMASNFSRSAISCFPGFSSCRSSIPGLRHLPGFAPFPSSCHRSGTCESDPYQEASRLRSIRLGAIRKPFPPSYEWDSNAGCIRTCHGSISSRDNRISIPWSATPSLCGPVEILPKKLVRKRPFLWRTCRLEASIATGDRFYGTMRTMGSWFQERGLTARLRARTSKENSVRSSERVRIVTTVGRLFGSRYSRRCSPFSTTDLKASSRAFRKIRMRRSSDYRNISGAFGRFLSYRMLAEDSMRLCPAHCKSIRGYRQG